MADWINDGHGVTLVVEHDFINVRLLCPDDRAHEEDCALASYFDNCDPLEMYGRDEPFDLSGRELPLPIEHQPWLEGDFPIWRFAP